MLGEVQAGPESGKMSSLKGLSNIAMGCPGRWWSHCPWRCSRKDCTWHSVPWSAGHSGDKSKAGLQHLRGPFQSKWFGDYVRFYESMEKTVSRVFCNLKMYLLQTWWSFIYIWKKYCIDCKSYETHISYFLITTSVTLTTDVFI